MMSSSLVKNSGPKLSPQSDVRVRDTGEGHIMRQYSEEKKRRLKSTARDVKTPQLPELHCLLARHDTTGKPAKPMMPDAATQTSSSDHFEESSRRYAKWEEEVRLEEVRHLQRVAIGLFKFSMHKAQMIAVLWISTYSVNKFRRLGLLLVGNRAFIQWIHLFNLP
ncbi:uncharacterized protein [Periplaneta americana]|uniref:uncharacterized protein isoform X4 n=1 Tax=Periplaneta americana TaxID=6978 RepID=UPI0037E9C365